MTSKKVSSLALRLAAAALACACAALAGCGERRVPPNKTRAPDDVFETRLAALHDEARDLRRAEARAAQALADARTSHAPPAEIAALEKKLARATSNLVNVIERQEAVCEERRLAAESQQSKR